MKVENSQSRLPVEWQSYLCRIFPSDSFDSTIYVQALKENEEDPAHQHVSSVRRRVSFSTAKDEIIPTQDNNKYHNDINLVKELWYTRRQVDYFRAEARVLARAWLAADNPQEETWVQGLYRAYWMFCNCNDNEEQEYNKDDQGRSTTNNNKMPVPVVDAAVGLERRVILNTAVGRDRHARRQQLFARLHLIAETVEDAAQREYLVAQAAQATSRPARLHAAYLAQWWWQGGSDDHDENSTNE